MEINLCPAFIATQINQCNLASVRIQMRPLQTVESTETA